MVGELSHVLGCVCARLQVCGGGVGYACVWICLHVCVEVSSVVSALAPHSHISPCSIKGLQAMAASTVCQVCFGTDLIACVRSQVSLGLRPQSLIYNRPQHEVSRACRERHHHFVNASLLTPSYPGPTSKHLQTPEDSEVLRPSGTSP